MLKVITSDEQTDPMRIWFNDENHDLFIWFDQHQTPVGFQFCYDKQYREYVISWHHVNGYSHEKIDAGEWLEGHYKMTPIMLPDDNVEKHRISRQFQSISAALNPALRDFIYQKLLSFPGT